MISHEEVNELVAKEIKYQDNKWGEAHDRKHEVPAWLLLLAGYADKARDAWINYKGDQAALQQVIKLAALAHNTLKVHGVVGMAAR